MFKKYLLSILLFLYIVLFSSGRLYAQEEEGEIIIISERVGKEIDQAEREKYKLFERVKGFQSAVHLKLPDGSYFLKITYLDERTGELKISRVLQSEASIKNRGDYIDRFEEIEAKKVNEIRASQESIYQASGTSFYVEFGGKHWCSLNVDYRKNKSAAMALGIFWLEDTCIPSLMYYRFRGKTYRTEIGGGVSGVFTKELGFAALLIHGDIGYRYQKKNGMLFRIAFTPLMGIPFTSEGRFGIVPWAGISFGFSL